MIKTVLITGATTGIGKATAVAFAKKGFNVVATGRKIEKEQELVEQVKKAGANVLDILRSICAYELISFMVDYY